MTVDKQSTNPSRPPRCSEEYNWSKQSQVWWLKCASAATPADVWFLIVGSFWWSVCLLMLAGNIKPQTNTHLTLRFTYSFTYRLHLCVPTLHILQIFTPARTAWPHSVIFPWLTDWSDKLPACLLPHHWPIEPVGNKWAHLPETSPLPSWSHQETPDRWR